MCKYIEVMPDTGLLEPKLDSAQVKSGGRGMRPASGARMNFQGAHDV